MGASIGFLSDSTRQSLFGGHFELLSLTRDHLLHLRHAPAALSAAFVGVEHIARTTGTRRNCRMNRFFAYSVAIANIHEALPVLASKSHSYLDQNGSSCKCLAIKLIGNCEESATWRFTWKAFAAGYAFAKAVFEFERTDVASAKPNSPLDSLACAERITERL